MHTISDYGPESQVTLLHQRSSSFVTFDGLHSHVYVIFFQCENGNNSNYLQRY